MGNEKSYYIISAITICILVLLFAGTCRYCFYLTNQLEQYRSDVELARVRTEQYEGIIESARNTNNELGECLNRQSASLSELRVQLQEVRKYYEEMENRLYISGNNNNNNINNSGNNS